MEGLIIVLVYAVVMFVIGLVYGANLRKGNFLRFALIGGVISGILAIIFIFFIAGIAGQIASVTENASFFLVYGATSFICLYAGAWLIGRRKKGDNEVDGEKPPREDFKY